MKKQKGKLYIVLEFASGGTLQDAIRANRGRPMPEAAVWRAMVEVLLGLCEMHSPPPRAGDGPSAAGSAAEEGGRDGGGTSESNTADSSSNNAGGGEPAHNDSRRHRRPLLHRDIKPANVLIGADGGAKLGDFGVAAVLGASAGRGRGRDCGGVDGGGLLGRPAADCGGDGGPRSPAAAVGTPLYLAPELCLGEPCSDKTDVSVWATPN